VRKETRKTQMKYKYSSLTKPRVRSGRQKRFSFSWF